MPDERCTCPAPTGNSATLREGNKECPEHGLAAIARELEGMVLYKLPDGFRCFARSRAEAERCRDRHRAGKA